MPHLHQTKSEPKEPDKKPYWLIDRLEEKLFRARDHFREKDFEPGVIHIAMKDFQVCVGEINACIMMIREFKEDES